MSVNDRPPDPRQSDRANRRAFLLKAGGLAGALVTPVPSLGARPEPGVYPEPSRRRVDHAYALRMEFARRMKKSTPAQTTNGDAERYPNKIGTFTKALPHNRLGEVDLKAFGSLLRALGTGDPADFESIPMGGDRKFTNPLSGYAYETQGGDPQGYIMRSPPAFNSAELAGEATELYWMAMTRDVPFIDYDRHELTRRAAADLSRLSDFRGPRANGKVTTTTLYRGAAPGVNTGPYISQFMYRDAYFGSEKIGRRFRTVFPETDYAMEYRDWLLMQDGNSPWRESWDPIPRYIRNGRDLAQWVHYDVLFQAYLDALLVLFALGARHFMGSPYRASRTQMGFGTLGSTHIASLVCGVSKPALKTVWYQKWLVHMRLRPEEFAGRIHNHAAGAASYPVHQDVLASDALRRTFDRQKTYLLAQAFPEGCPTHPAYGAGHATVAGACVTVLKAFFDESFVFRSPVVPSPDGTGLVPYEGPELTVGGELNKLAYNVANGRNIAGIHWRTDADESLKLGEAVAIDYLREERGCLQEKFNFSITKFDGTKVEF
jgi:hypothetical protein